MSDVIGRKPVTSLSCQLCSTQQPGSAPTLAGNWRTDGATAFFERDARLYEHVDRLIAGMGSIPVDIRPLYPDSI